MVWDHAAARLSANPRPLDRPWKPRDPLSITVQYAGHRTSAFIYRGTKIAEEEPWDVQRVRSCAYIRDVLALTWQSVDEKNLMDCRWFSGHGRRAGSGFRFAIRFSDDPEAPNNRGSCCRFFGRLEVNGDSKYLAPVHDRARAWKRSPNAPINLAVRQPWERDS